MKYLSVELFNAAWFKDKKELSLLTVHTKGESRSLFSFIYENAWGFKHKLTRIEILWFRLLVEDYQ